MRNKLKKYMEDFYNEEYKTLSKEMKWYKNKCRNICHINGLLRCQFSSELSIDLFLYQQNPKLDFFVCVKIDKLILKFMCRCKEHRMAKTILKKKNKVPEDWHCLILRLRAMAIKILWQRQIAQWNRIGSRNSLHIYG